MYRQHTRCTSFSPCGLSPKCLQSFISSADITCIIVYITPSHTSELCHSPHLPLFSPRPSNRELELLAVTVLEAELGNSPHAIQLEAPMNCRSQGTRGKTIEQTGQQLDLRSFLHIRTGILHTVREAKFLHDIGQGE